MKSCLRIFHLWTIQRSFSGNYSDRIRKWKTKSEKWKTVESAIRLRPADYAATGGWWGLMNPAIVMAGLNDRRWDFKIINRVDRPFDGAQGRQSVHYETIMYGHHKDCHAMTVRSISSASKRALSYLGCPIWPPIFRLFFLLFTDCELMMSDDGGLEEFEEFFSSRAIFSCRSIMYSRSCLFSSVSCFITLAVWKSTYKLDVHSKQSLVSFFDWHYNANLFSIRALYLIWNL